MTPESNLLDSIVRATGDAVITTDPDGVITGWNPAAERLYGRPASEAIGRPVAVLFAPAPGTGKNVLFDQVVGGETLEHRMVGLPRADGSPIEVELTASPLLGPLGQVVGVVSLSREVGQAARADERFRGFLAGAPDAIVAVRSGGEISFANAMALELFGYTSDELLGHQVEMLLPDYARDRHADLRHGYQRHPMTRAMNAGAQLWGRRADGTTFPAEISLSPVRTDGGVVTLAAIRDRTAWLAAEANLVSLRAEAEQSRLREELMRAQRMDSLGNMAGGITHDFNNLLSVIMSYAQAIAESARDGGRSGTIGDDADRIVKWVTRGEQLTRQLLAFVRRESTCPAVCDLNEVVCDVVAMLERILAKPIRVWTELSAGVPAVLVDPGQIEQILLNLAVNARDAMPQGGVLTFATGVREIDATFRGIGAHATPGRYVAIEVTDTGSGMPPELIDRIFDPFFTTKERGQGTGLGLAMVHGIVTGCQGILSVRSTPGAGTTFTVLFPALDHESGLPPASPVTPRRPLGDPAHAS